ncbi:MAG TPA: HAD-IA family hydrolase [Arenimonas sp.]|uniref:HAD-IA family hydrolase n=1 Tax=Arenimonas sp. TaxID=1872635 RepID=UPI002D7F121F|nr:HAD-IA family hydrolase [Arenimonas sp.]HEU0153215.1 HAD-IA family hydrolase [Arenimonas sp.]
MSRPALVLFDLDDVLVGYDHARRLATLAERTGTTPKVAHRALFTAGVEKAADQGVLDIPGTLAALARELGAPVTLDDWIAARADAMSARPEVLALARATAEVAEVAILTNNGLLLRDHLEQMHPPLFPLFRDRIYCSAQFGRSKPDPAIYRDCLAALGVAPADALFIDDKVANANGARAAGLKAHHYTGSSSLRSALATHRLLEPSA